LLPPSEKEVPALGLISPSPGEEKDEDEATADRTGSDPAQGQEPETKIIGNGDAVAGDGNSELVKAERRYEGR
jgi:hypothetical protein